MSKSDLKAECWIRVELFGDSYVYRCGYVPESNRTGRGIPFTVTLPKVPESIDVTKMNVAHFHAKLQKGYKSYKTGKI